MSRRDKIERMIQKAYTRMNSQVGLSKVIAGTKNRYGDMKGNTWATPVLFYAQAQYTPIEAQMEDSGWHKDLTDIKVRVPLVELQRVNLADNLGQVLFSIGDRLIYDKQNFEIRAINLHQPSVDNLPISIHIEGLRGVS